LTRLLRASGLQAEDVSGIAYDPWRRKAWQSRSTAGNDLLSARKPACA
jgi:2-polyprenyl-6-hydroxyphenyl methylase/3-demethylubiquinone-9 3-methyltransferase